MVRVEVVMSPLIGMDYGLSRECNGDGISGDPWKECKEDWRCRKLWT